MRAMRRRRIGFSETLFQNGTPASDYHEILLPISAAAARETVRQIWTRSSFDAVFCGTDLLAIGAIKGYNDIGVRVPDDVQIIGFDPSFFFWKEKPIRFRESTGNTMNIPPEGGWTEFSAGHLRADHGRVPEI